MGVYEEKKTEDGSVTYFNKEKEEHCHSVFGAKEEAVKKFVEPCREKLLEEKIVVFDVCFGVGYNSVALIEEVMKINKDAEIIIYAFEKDREIISKVKEVNPPFEHYSLIKRLSSSGSVEEGSILIKLLIGGAEERIEEVEENADVVFLDPFSPKNEPVLWEENFLKKLHSKTENGGVLTTYSCARKVRDNLKKAGFKVEDGPRVKRRGPSTIAIKE